MSAEITHVRDPQTGHYRQIVTPAQLRRILRRNGESLERPSHFGPGDEWQTQPGGGK